MTPNEVWYLFLVRRFCPPVPFWQVMMMNARGGGGGSLAGSSYISTRSKETATVAAGRHGSCSDDELLGILAVCFHT